MTQASPAATAHTEWTSKWPISLTLIRHIMSEYNALKAQRDQHPRYPEFVAMHKAHFGNPNLHAHVPVPSQLRTLAIQMWQEFKLACSSPDTPILEQHRCTAVQTGQRLMQEGIIELPDVIFVSPYLRTQQTLEALTEGWPELKNVKVIADERLREQEHGLATLYNDWRVFQCLHPEQHYLREQEGEYHYRYPQGESVADVRERFRLLTTTLIREYSGKHVLAITHHLAILAFMANLERWDEQGFLYHDKQLKPVNCGVTTFRCDPTQGEQGKLLRVEYNQKLY